MLHIFNSVNSRIFRKLSQVKIKPIKFHTKHDLSFSRMSSAEDTLIFANVIFRHGDRNIGVPYPNDPYKDERHWPEGFSQLTKVGMQRLYRLGQYFRRRYNNILGEKYSKNDLYAQSSDTDRTLMSAQCCLAGLYPPTEDEKFIDDILWRPVPVHTVPRHLDYIIAVGADKSLNDLIREYTEQSAELKRFFTEYADQIAYWEEMSGKNLSLVGEICLMYDTISIEKEQNKTIPEWAEKATEPGGAMEQIARFGYTMFSGTPKLAEISFGHLLKEIVEHFVHKANGTLKPDRVLWLYSGHDYTIFNALNSLGMLTELHIPPNAASLHFELYRRSDNSHYVQIVYRKLEEENPPALIIPGHGEKCSLDDFIKISKKVIPCDTESESHL